MGPEGWDWAREAGGGPGVTGQGAKAPSRGWSWPREESLGEEGVLLAAWA